MSSPLWSSQASAIWPGLAPFAAAISRTGAGRRDVGVVIGALIARVVVAEVVLRIVLGALDRAGQEAAAERREGDEPDAEFAQRRDDLRLQVALPQRIFALQRRHRMDRMGAADVGDAGLRQAEVAHLALPDEVGDGAGDVLDRHGRIDPVLIEEVDMVGLEPLERAFHRLADVRRAAVEAGALLAVVEAEAELGGDGHLVAAAGERAAEQLLVLEGAIDLGGVEEGAAEFDGAMQRGDRLGFVRRAVGLAHAHAAEADRRDLQPLAAELARGHGHGRCPFMSMSATGFRGRSARHAVERALQDVGRRHLVDDLAAALAAGIGVDERAGDGGGRQALVPEENRQMRSACRDCGRRRGSPGRAGPPSRPC